MTGARTLLEGRGLLESPRWRGEQLYVSDWSAGEVLVVGPGGRCDVAARVASLPLCTAWQPDGRLLVVDSAAGRLRLLEPDGTLTVGHDLGRTGWNDVVVDGRANAYVNRAGFDPMAGEEVRPGFVAIVTRDGTVRDVADDIGFPNGMAVTPDNDVLVVADSYRNCLLGFDIEADGTLSGRRIWADLGDGVPDGICLDADGAVWYADVPHRRCVRVAEGGSVLQTVDLDRGAFACALGGAEGRTLAIAAAEWRGMEVPGLVTPGSGQVLVLDVDSPGAGWP